MNDSTFVQCGRYGMSNEQAALFLAHVGYVLQAATLGEALDVLVNFSRDEVEFDASQNTESKS